MIQEFDSLTAHFMELIRPGPGTEPVPPIYKDNKWQIRVLYGNSMPHTPPKGFNVEQDSHYIFFYIDGPLDGIDDGSINNIMSWESYVEEPIFQFGDYSGIPE